MEEPRNDTPENPPHEAGEPRCARSRRRGVKTSHIILLGVAITAGSALLVTGFCPAFKSRYSGWIISKPPCPARTSP